jgi:hypothetical protein
VQGSAGDARVLIEADPDSSGGLRLVTWHSAGECWWCKGTHWGGSWQLWRSQVRNLTHFSHLDRKTNSLYFKGTVSRNFRPPFFHQSTPPWAQIHGLEPFCIWLRTYSKKLKQYSNFSEVNDPTETILAGSLIPLKLFQRGHWLRQNEFRRVIDPANEIYLNQLNFKIVVLGPRLFKKGYRYFAKLFQREITPYHILTLN